MDLSNMWGMIEMVSLVLSMACAVGAAIFAYLGFVEQTAKRSQELGFTKGETYEESEPDSLLLKYIKPLLPPVIVWIKPYIQEESIAAVNATIRRSGLKNNLTALEFFGMKVFLTLVLPFVMGPALGNFVGKPNFVYWIIGAVFGWFGTDFWIYELAKQRSHKILKALPDMLDMLVLLVEAGLDLSAAIIKLTDTLPKSPLRDELQTMISDMRLGASRIEAMKNMAERINLMEMNSFVSVLVQAIEMGASVGPVLRTQADMLRLARFQKAERLGAEASNKVLIPMFLFIFPAIFMVAIGPVAVDFIRNPVNIF